MPPLPPLPRSELEIARIVWDLGEATVRQVAEALQPTRDIDFWTVQTYLRRLSSKGYLRVERRGRANVYRPRVQPGRILSRLVHEFVERTFGGQALPLVQHLIREQGLSEDEIDELQRTLERLKERKK
ncbi:MAG: BlaI/MecI/CopY family transcriptional regulator [Planctomycetaceae bacterium]